LKSSPPPRLPVIASLFPALAAFGLAIGLTAVLFSQAPSPSVTMLARDGRRPLPLTIVGDQEFVGLDDLAAAFQLAVQESLGAITVSYKGKTIVLTADQSLASVAGRLISLPAAPTRSGRRWLVPVEFVSRALAPIYDTRLELRKPSHLLIIGDLRVPRVAIRYDSLGAAGRLTIDATPRTASTVSQDNDHITVKFEADALDTPAPLFVAPPPPSLVQAIRTLDPLTLVIDLAPRFGGFKATTQPVDNTARLVLDLAASQTDAPAPLAPPAPTAPPELPPAFGQAPAFRTIAIDPGHGGDDEGARGANGVKEKDLALAVARRIRALLEARLGIRVLLTRDDDRNVPIDERTAVANNNKADLFVSIHANASMRTTTAGAAVYCAEFDKDSAQAASRRGAERVPAFGGGLRDVEMVPWGLAQTRHLTQSAAFAEILLQQLRDRVPLAPPPANQAPLRVLESANMPAVLVELGYLSNPGQERALAGEAFQSLFVQALYDAVVRYRDSLPSAGAP
jgi:N-acetylmuramoyl-L-alanine amidase